MMLPLNFFRKKPQEEEDPSSPNWKKTATKRRKKKEEQKPWGKKERLIVLISFGVTTLTSALLAFSARNWKLPGLPRIILPQINLEQKYVLQRKVEEEEGSEKVKKEISDLAKNLSGVYGLYVIRLTDGSSYGVNENEVFEAASLIKLPVLAMLFQEAQNGNINLNQKYSLKNSDKLSGSGSLGSKSEGTLVSYRELAQLMGKQSDNTAFNIVRHTLGDENIQEFINRIGLKNTSLKNNKTSPSDIGKFFKKLMDGSIVDDEFKEEILENLTDTWYENLIPAGIGHEIRVSHKYGSETHVLNDAGVVFTSKPFVLVIMSKGIVEKEAQAVIPVIARRVYDFELER